MKEERERKGKKMVTKEDEGATGENALLRKKKIGDQGKMKDRQKKKN